MGDTKYPCGDEEQKRLAHDITLLLWTHLSLVCDITVPKAMISQLLNSDNRGGGVHGGSPLTVTLYIKNKISRYISLLSDFKNNISVRKNNYSCDPSHDPLCGQA